MGVKGLNSYVIQNVANFAEFQLHNTRVVIDALNFLNHLYMDSGLDTQYNGENFDLQVAIVKVLRVFRKCLIRPVFIFDGCHIGAKLRTQLKRARDRLQTSRTLAHYVLSHPTGTNRAALCVPILPPLALLVLTQTLIALHVPFVVSDRESDEDAVALAIHFQCPVISNDSDFYITIPPNVSGTYFIPLQFISWSVKSLPVCCDKCVQSQPRSVQCYYLSCQRFLLDGPAFRQLPPIQRPLFATLVGNDYVSEHQFASVLPCSEGLRIPLSGTATKAMRINRRRTLYRELMQWLAGFGDNVQQPMERILNRIPKTERGIAQALLDQSLRSYLVSLDYAKTALLPFLITSNNSGDFLLKGPSVECSSDEEDGTFASGIVDPEYLSDDLNCTDSCLAECAERSSLLVSGEVLSDHSGYGPGHTQITHGWCDSLVHLFREYRILPIYLDALYSDGAVLNCGVEALRQCPSIHVCTNLVRHHIYCLILGTSLSSANTSLLSGLLSEGEQSSFVMEYIRKGEFHVRSCRMPVKPVKLDLSDLSNDSRLAFIQRNYTRYFNPTESRNGWLHALALLSCIWLNHNVPPSTDANRMTDCCHLLAFATLAIARRVTIEASNAPLGGLNHLKRTKQQLRKLAQYFSSLTNSDSKFPGSVHLYTVHIFGQLQLIYATLFTLGSVLDGLGGAHELEHCIPLSEVCTLFPSGRVYHALVHYLQGIASTDRASSIRHKVFPQLLSSLGEEAIEEAFSWFHEYYALIESFHDSYVGIGSTDDAVKLERVPNGNRNIIRQNNGTQRPVRKTRKKGPLKKTMKKSTGGLSMNELDAEIDRIMLLNGLTD